jgi:pyruvate kinase
VFVNYPGIDACKPGQQILLDDGLIALRAVRRKGDGELVVCVLDGGFLGARKGVNIPGVHLDLPPLSDKDKELLRVGLAKDIDYVAASFVSRGSDVRIIRAFLREEMQKLGLDPDIVLVPRIISKIENAEALDNFAEILQESDAIMIARGDLGVEIPFRKVTTAQKLMVQQCNQAGKPVIVATQMLESMIKNARPTRAEVSDVYNAVVDGADAVMLSGESAKGKYPIQSISTMQMILREAEKAGESLDHNRTRYIHKAPAERRLHALAEAAVLAADKINAKLIIVLSHRGQTARVVAKYRPRQAIMAMCTNPKAARQLNLELGVRAVLSAEETPAEGVRIARELGLAEVGDNVVMLLSEKDKDGTAPATHSIRIMVVPWE